MIDLVDASYLTGKEHYLEDVNHPLPGQIKAVRSAGYSRFYVYENSLREMGGEVARQALMKTGLDASDIDFIVAAHTSVADYPSIDFACQVGAELGIHKVKTRNVLEGCGTAITAFDAAEQFISANPESMGIVVQAQRVSDVHHDRFSLLNGILSDAAVATIVTAARPGNRYLLRTGAFEEISVPYFVDMMRMEFGGALHPEIPSNDDPQYYKPGRERLQDIYKMSSAELLDFLALRNSTMTEVIESVSLKTGWKEPANWLLHTLEGEQSVQAIASAAKIKNSNSGLVSNHGHCGCADPILSLIDLADTGSLKKGDRVILSTISSGMKWAALSGVAGEHLKNG
jgi:ehpO